ncbi:MAG TPA: hypothetical protein VF263_19645, partial [Longimicrobiaceae bacterium]
TRTLPPMMQVIQEIGGVELPQYFGKLTGDPAAPTADEVERALASAAAPPSPDDRARPAGERAPARAEDAAAPAAAE